MTVRDALMHSLNVATVKVAEMIGYQRVVRSGAADGTGHEHPATPAVALGAYEMTPIDVAAGYTAFATSGVRAEPLFIRSVVAADGSIEESHAPQTRPVLDPRVAFLVTSLMEDVINHGTGYPVRALGFNAPAAGKTGTSRDGWFAGYTSNLLCVVWVGFRRQSRPGLTGGATAAPDVGRVHEARCCIARVRNTQDFEPPDWRGAGDGGSAKRAARRRRLARRRRRNISSRAASRRNTAMAATATGGQSGSWLSHLFGGGTNPPPPPIRDGAPNGSNASRQCRRWPSQACGAQQGTQKRKRASSARYLVSLVERSLRTNRKRHRSIGMSGETRGLGAKEYAAMKHMPSSIIAFVLQLLPQPLSISLRISLQPNTVPMPVQPSQHDAPPDRRNASRYPDGAQGIRCGHRRLTRNSQKRSEERHAAEQIGIAYQQLGNSERPNVSIGSR